MQIRGRSSIVVNEKRVTGALGRRRDENEPFCGLGPRILPGIPGLDGIGEDAPLEIPAIMEYEI